MGSMGFKFQPKKSGKKKAEATSIHISAWDLKPQSQFHHPRKLTRKVSLNDVKLPGLPFSNRKIIFFRLSDHFLGGSMGSIGPTLGNASLVINDPTATPVTNCTKTGDFGPPRCRRGRRFSTPLVHPGWNDHPGNVEISGWLVVL